MRRYELEELDLNEKGHTECRNCPLTSDGCTTLPGRINEHLYHAVECYTSIVKLSPCTTSVTNDSELINALRGLMKEYKSLADSGDCGQWKAEDQKEYKAAEAAISNATK